jgi:glycosyltransferase involved in cell wall biosynthesis
MFTENIIKKWLRNKIRVRFCNFVFAVSPRLVKELRKNNISAIWLPPSVPDYYFSRSIYKEVKPKTVVSFIGRIDPSKGLADILESLKYSLETNDLSVLKIYGYFIPGNKESVALHNVLKNLNYVDYRAYSYDTYHYSLKGEEQLLDFISEADILILPYRDLTGTIDLPLLLLEALATGCVVISTDVGDIQNILGIHELIVKSPEEMIERIKSLSNFGMVKKYSDRIKAMNLFDTFSSKKVTEKFLSALECKSRIQ